jgi:glycogen operon protein
VGSFIGDRWNEWNGHFRDDIRSFLKGDRDTVRRLPARITASPDLYGHEEREPDQSVNFVTCHDGFTLNDLVSYNEKHNEVNGEDNQDGNNHNLSWNCGVEGPSDNPKIENLRNRQVKNFLAFTVMSLGTPMILMGDEVRRSQQGNNNAYCQDNEISWFDWGLLEKYADIHRYVKYLIQIRNNLGVHENHQGRSLVDFLHRANIQWHGVHINQPDWGKDSHSLSVKVENVSRTFAIYAMFNAYWKMLNFELPEALNGGDNQWRRLIDTGLESPHDICLPSQAKPLSESNYQVNPRSVVILIADKQ